MATDITTIVGAIRKTATDLEEATTPPPKMLGSVSGLTPVDKQNQLEIVDSLLADHSDALAKARDALKKIVAKIEQELPDSGE